MRLPTLAMIACVLASTLGLALGSAPGPAFGASRQDHDDCNADDPDRNIVGCTRIIDDPSEQPKTRAIAHVGRALALHSKGKLDDAMADLDAAIRLNPDDGLAYNNRGVLWREKNDIDRAIADFTAAIRAGPLPRSDLPGPGYVNVYTNRGLAWQAKGELDQALADFDQALVQDANDVEAHFRRAQIRTSRHEFAPAIADLDEVIRLDPTRTDAYYLRGKLRYNQYMSASAWIEARDLDGAIADFGEVIRRNPDNAAVRSARGTAFVINGDRDRAIADFTAAVELNPTDTTTIAALRQLKPDYQPPTDLLRNLLDWSPPSSKQ